MSRGVDHNALRLIQESYHALGIKEKEMFRSWLDKERKVEGVGLYKRASVIWNYMVDQCLEQWGIDIEFSKAHEATSTRTLVILNLHDRWVPGITYSDLAQISKLHKTTISRAGSNMVTILKKPRIGYWAKVHARNDALMQLFNEMNISEE